MPKGLAADIIEAFKPYRAARWNFMAAMWHPPKMSWRN